MSTNNTNAPVTTTTTTTAQQQQQQQTTSGRNLALPVTSATKDLTKTEIGRVEEPAAAAAIVQTEPTREVLAIVPLPQQQQQMLPLTPGDQSYVTGVAFSVAGFALSFGPTVIVITHYFAQQPRWTNPVTSDYMIEQTALAFAFLFLIFQFFAVVILARSLADTSDLKEKAAFSGLLLSVFTLILIIISTACYGSISGVFTIPNYNDYVNHVLATQICAIILVFISIIALSHARGYWRDAHNPRPMKPLAFLNKDISPLLVWTLYFSAINLAFSIGAVYFLTNQWKENNRFGLAIDSHNDTAFAFVLLYFISAILAAAFAIVALVPNPTVHVRTSVIINWSTSLCAFCFSLIAAGFILTFNSQPQYLDGMIIGAFITSLVAFSLGVAAFGLIEGNQCCAACNPYEPGGVPVGGDPVAKALVNLQIERINLEKAKLERERLNLQQSGALSQV